MSRHFATAAIVQAAPGYRELRITIREQGQADDVALIAVRPMHDTPDVLAAFGWHLVSKLEYVAGPNEERAEVEPCEPADHGGAQALRDAVRREIRARTRARVLVHSSARHFQPVLLNGDHSADPIGWTFVVGVNHDRGHGWVTSTGAVSRGPRIPTRADAARSVRHEYMAQMTEARIEEADDSAAYAQLQQQPGDVLTRLLLIVRNGGTAPVDEEPVEEPAGEVEGPVFRKGDRIVCADGVTRTVEAMAPAVTGEPARVVVEGAGEWIAGNCLRANWEDVLAAHRRSNAALLRVRTEPDPTNPKWRAALTELGEALDYLRKADPTVGVALAEDDAREAATRVHPDASGFQPIHNPGEDEPVAWTFRTGHGAGSRYGVVTRTAEVSPVGLYEYPTTAERAWRRHEAELTR
ncbi:hypothetical protein [Streptomyces sp. enrichment culture]|uniref:hypothetical protein n=1 Tax=Streptomyces sp. enrichment culture TaxID=1795815 RepID=UPI003F56368E